MSHAMSKTCVSEANRYLTNVGFRLVLAVLLVADVNGYTNLEAGIISAGRSMEKDLPGTR